MLTFMNRLMELIRRIRCIFISLFRPILGRPPSGTCWLCRHPKVAWQSRWRFTFDTSAYDIPDTAKRPWIDWTAAEKQELQAFDDTWTWFESQSGTFTPAGETVAHPPPEPEGYQQRPRLHPLQQQLQEHLPAGRGSAPATYESWFGTSTDNRSEGCDKIGHQVAVLAGS